MDKQTTLGFILIGLVLIIWMWLQAPTPQRQLPMPSDSVSTSEGIHEEKKKPEKTGGAEEAAHTKDPLGKHFSRLSTGTERVLIVRTDLYTAEITTRGGLVRKWELHKYLTWDGYPVQLVDMEHGGDFSLLFTSADGKLINTRDLYFQSDYADWQTVVLKNDDTVLVSMVLQVDSVRSIVKQLTFRNGAYSFDAVVKFFNVGDIISNFEYQVVWDNGIRYAEHNSVDESSFAMGYAYSGGELTEVNASSPGEVSTKDISGSTEWVAAVTKYFAVALLPEEGRSQGAFVGGVATPQPDQGMRETYSLGLKMPLRGLETESAGFTVFLGPLDFDVVNSYDRDLDQVMSLGAAWIIRPISEYVMIPLFSFLRLFIPNFGVVIIVFSIIIKVALYPLTKTSMKSMKKMQALQPMMTEIREKHKDDPQKMNQQIMNLYKEYGVNPASGCLPLLLQMPILYALYMVFRSSIELRQASFVWWVKDLSIPDSIVKLPFTIPLFGISDVSGLALAMGITMFLQQKMTVTDPRQKAMVWMMPVMMTLLFNSFPSGLNLYYLVFNVLSIGQQMWITKKHGNEPLRKVETKKKTGGVMARLTKELPKFK
jgi:YidC/Oxa1 family membrane protein insertase